ncbi:MAG: hypothetical protein HYX61_09950 [Gammaproteobacteria bacterium]|jgi:hypothetical protein|nr:hypothetical protein [Gammaproteobacteria bacterium]
MIIYNAFPLAYQNIDQLTTQLPTISHMGFNIVWLNPIQNSRRTLHTPGGSLYSMNHEDLFLSQWYGGDVWANEQALERLQQEAKRQDLTLMFDLVMKQVGNQLAKAHQNKHLFKDVSRGEFNYSTDNLQAEIFEIFFKPFLKRYVAKYGFTGMRIDGAGYIPSGLQKRVISYFRHLTKKHHHTDGIILGEFLEDNEKLYSLKEQDVKYDLVTNSSYWTVNPSPYFDPSKRTSHNDDMFHRRQLSSKGTIGWTGNHDTKNLYHTCASNLPTHFSISVAQSNTMLAKMMRERLATMAFISDGGYYLLCGDEYGSSQRRNCFEWEGHEFEPALRQGQTANEKWAGKFDMTEFIRQVNLARTQLGQHIDPCFWSEQYVLSTLLDPNHDIKCVVRNNGTGFTNSMDIVLVNVNPNQDYDFIIDTRFIENITQQIKSTHSEFDLNKNDIKIHLIGKIAINGLLPYPCIQASLLESMPSKIDELDDSMKKIHISANM